MSVPEPEMFRTNAAKDDGKNRRNQHPHACVRVVMGMHWTEVPDRSNDQTGKTYKAKKIVFAALGQSKIILSTFSPPKERIAIHSHVAS